MEDLHYIERVIKGDLHAYTPLVEKYRQYVYVLVKRTCPHPAEAEELTQDVFVKAYEHLSTFRRASAFSTWLYRIAFNTAISHARKKKRYGVSIDDIDPRHFATSEEETGAEYDNVLRKEQAYTALERLLASLPADEQILVSLFYKQGLKMEEVAYISGLTPTNAKVKIHRIRKKLYMLFQEDYSNETNE